MLEGLLLCTTVLPYVVFCELLTMYNSFILCSVFVNYLLGNDNWQNIVTMGLPFLMFIDHVNIPQLPPRVILYSAKMYVLQPS